MKKKGKVLNWKFSLGIVMGILVLFLVACSNDSNQEGQQNSQEVFKWRLATHQMPGTARYEGTIVPFVESVKEASNGRLIIEPYGAGTLFPVNETFDSVNNGVVEMGAIFSGFWAGKDPVFALAGGIPGDPIQNFSEHFYRDKKLAPILEKAYEKHGVKYLGSFDYGPDEILMTNSPIRSVEDFKGLNIRAAGLATSYYDKLGAAAVSVAAPEIYTALQLGTVDGAEYNDFLVNSEMGMHEVTKYVIEPAMHVGPVNDKELIVNPSAWNKLPADLQAIVLTAMDQARFNSAIAYDVDNSRAKQVWLDEGVEMIQLPEAEVDKLREVAFDLLNEYRDESADTADYLDAYAEVLFELGYVDEASRLGYSN
ncbi:TRAP transporter substrate-binding protein [Anaerobacillus sp. MEB173]|uniref:TRAP transporter substrate-binding protein n=1 Tax=Anaerobacillus sp. MEB173 TaxID=3383345 RepID=UPI003F8FE668